MRYAGTADKGQLTSCIDFVASEQESYDDGVGEIRRLDDQCPYNQEA